MNEQNNNMPQRGESIFKFIMPVLIMLAVQFLVQLFAGQLMFFYKGYTYTEGTYDDFVMGYQNALISDKFVMAESMLSTFVLAVVFLVWYRSAIVHSANMSLRQKCKVKGVLNWKIVPGVLLTGAGAGVFATYVIQFITQIKPDLLETGADVMSMISADNSLLVNVALIIYFVVLTPICQELAFRGLTLGFAERRMRFLSANIIQAILFGALSMNVPQMIYFFAFGLVLGYVYYRTENILIPIMCNMMFCITRLVLNNVDFISDNIVAFFLTFLVGMIGAYVGVALIKQSKVTDNTNVDM